jgi:DNA primase
MDSVSEIKARLPIEDLVAQYCKIEKKGRSFKALCPFHNDKKPSFLISPDKGIAYCFACQNKAEAAQKKNGNFSGFGETEMATA